MCIVSCPSRRTTIDNPRHNTDCGVRLGEGTFPLPERCRFYRHAQADGNAAHLSVKQIYLAVRRLTVTIVTAPANIRIPIMPKGNSTPDFGISASTVSTAF